MKNLIIIFLSVFILSCATPPQISDDAFISSQPNFKVQFKKPVVKKWEKSNRIRNGDLKRYYFSVNRWEGILIHIYTHIPDRSGWGFHGLTELLTNMGRIPLDPLIIDGHQWIKFVDLSDTKYLYIGYFMQIDNYLISVGRISNSDAYTEALLSVKRGSQITDKEKKLLDEFFERTGQLFTIGRN